MNLMIQRGRGPGTWRPLMVLRDDHYEWKAIIECPECGRYLAAVNHDIDADGQISPSLGHPTEYPPCGWHVNPCLNGWHPEQWQLPSVPKLTTCPRCNTTTARWLSGWGTWGGVTGDICLTCIAALANKEDTE